MTEGGGSVGEPMQSFTESRVYQMACDLDYQVF
jgi:hypothetical protein